MILNGFRYNDAPHTWALVEADYEVKSIGQLLYRFYSEFDIEDPEVNKPLAFSRDPQNKDQKPIYGPYNNVVVLPYRRNFYIVVEKKYREIYGPHCARIFYKCRQIDDVVWVAILQFEAMFYNDEAILKAVTEGILSHGFYQSPQTRDEIVVL